MKSVSSACWHNSANGTWAGDKNPCSTALFIIDCRRWPSDASVNPHHAGEAYMMRLIKTWFSVSGPAIWNSLLQEVRQTVNNVDATIQERVENFLHAKATLKPLRIHIERAYLINQSFAIFHQWLIIGKSFFLNLSISINNNNNKLLMPCV